MDLKSHLSHMKRADRSAFATLCGTTAGHLTNVAYGYKPCGEKLAVAIERHSGRAVTRQELRPNDWQEIWPELVENDGS